MAGLGLLASQSRDVQQVGGDVRGQLVPWAATERLLHAKNQVMGRETGECSRNKTVLLQSNFLVSYL